MQSTGQQFEQLLNALRIETCNMQPEKLVKNRLYRKYQTLKAKKSKHAQAAHTEWFFSCCGITLDMLKAIATGSIRVQYGRGSVLTIGDATIVEVNGEAMIKGTLLSESIGKGRNFTIRANAVTKVL